VRTLTSATYPDFEEAAVAVETDPLTLPLSYGERALWLTQQRDPGSTAYNIGVALRITQPVDERALRAALQELVDRHLVLHSSFVSYDGEPVRRLSPVAVLPFARVDARNWTTARLDDELTTAIGLPFDLATPPLVRAVLYCRDSADYMLLLVAHHMVFDSGSLAAILPELRARYLAAVESRPLELACERTATYAEYVAWQHDFLEGIDGAVQREYWHNQLVPEPPVLELLSDRPRPTQKRSGGGTVRFSLDASVVRDLKRFAHQEHTTVYTLLLSAFEVLLHRYSGQDDLLIGAPMAGRTQKRFRHTVGYCVNPVALRSSVAGDPSVRTLVGQVHRTVRGARHHQDYPLARLVDELEPRRDASRSPIFDVLFNHMRARSGGEARAEGHTTDLLPMTTHPVRHQE